jgi:(E)-4-hydroxy-3-methyl-but-2-enyl pyrophosphate reductase
MEIIKARNSGFCFGVKRAMDMVLKEREKRTGRMYTLGPIIHNPQIVQRLMEKDIIPVDDIRQVTEGTVVFRTHGVLKEEEEYARGLGLPVIDATCPFVKRVRKRAIHLHDKGYQVVIVGDGKHPEVKSVLSYLNNDGIVLQNLVPISAKKIGVVSQTTLDKDTFTEVVRGLIGGGEEARIYSTICESTEIRQKEVEELSSAVDVMLIVGGRNSSNTTKLYNLAKRSQPNTHHIETEDEIKPEWFVGANKAGLAGGASTPEDIIDSVARRLNNF